jgi:hypothetical protein
VSYEVFRKSTVENLLGEGSVVRDYRELDDDVFFLLHSWEISAKSNAASLVVDSIFLHSLNSGKVEGFRIVYRKNIEATYYTIRSLTRTSLVIEYWNSFMSEMEVHRLERMGKYR